MADGLRSVLFDGVRVFDSLAVHEDISVLVDIAATANIVGVWRGGVRLDRHARR